MLRTDKAPPKPSPLTDHNVNIYTFVDFADLLESNVNEGENEPQLLFDDDFKNVLEKCSMIALRDRPVIASRSLTRRFSFVYKRESTRVFSV